MDHAVQWLSFELGHVEPWMMTPKYKQSAQYGHGESHRSPLDTAADH